MPGFNLLCFKLVKEGKVLKHFESMANKLKTKNANGTSVALHIPGTIFILLFHCVLNLELSKIFMCRQIVW